MSDIIHVSPPDDNLFGELVPVHDGEGAAQKEPGGHMALPALPSGRSVLPAPAMKGGVEGIEVALVQPILHNGQGLGKALVVDDLPLPQES